MRSIGTKLAAIFIAIFLFVIAATSGALIFISTTSIQNLTLGGMEYRIDLQAKSLDQALSERAMVIQSLGEIIEGMDTRNSAQIQGLLSPIFDAHEDYNLYVGFSDNQAFFADLWEPESSWIATERDWYAVGAKNPGKVSSTEPYVDDMTGEICFTMVYGMVKDGQMIGVVALDIMQDVLLDIMQDAKYDAQGQYSMLLDSAGNIYYHPESEYAPSKAGTHNLLQIGGNDYAPIFARTGNSKDIVLENSKQERSYYVPVRIEDSDWIVCGVIPVSELTQKTVEQILYTVLIGGVSLLVAILIVLYITKKMITAPIKQMVQAAKTMADGDLDITITADSNDELGEFGRAFQAILNDTRARVKTIQAVADGDLTTDIPAHTAKDVMSLALSDMLYKNNIVMNEILTASGMVAQGSRKIADISQSLAAGSAEQNQAVENLTARISHISDITRQTMQHSSDAARLGDEMIIDAKNGGAQMSEMLNAVKAIDEASRSIGHVIKSIDDIAFQTNILALNASVEAARAGQHGKGFAVVAEEVRSLATKSAEAAKNTGALISDSIEKAELGSHLAGQTAVSFEQIVNKLNLSVDKIKEISDFSERQVNSVQMIDSELGSVARVVQQNSTSAEEASSAAEKMSEQSNMLERAIAQFTLKDSQPSDRRFLNASHRH